MNNIEEDIKILEEFIEGLKQYDLKTGKDIEPVEFGEGQRYVYKNVYMAIFNVLSEREQDKARIKELEEKYYYEKNRAIVELDTVYIKARYDEKDIWISLIKDKIEELKKEYKVALEENSTKSFILKCQIEVVQELLEEK